MNFIKTYLGYFKIAAVVIFVAAIFFFGRNVGKTDVQTKWDKATIAQQKQDIQTDQERTAAVVAEVARSNAQAKADTEAAIMAAQGRQEERLKAAARAGALEGATRKPGTVYTECKLGDDELKILNEGLK